MAFLTAIDLGAKNQNAGAEHLLQPAASNAWYDLWQLNQKGP
jgi:hypothetical protein